MGVLAGFSSAATTITEGWDSSLDLGLTLTSGNSETTLFTAILNLGKTVGQDEYNAALAYAFSEAEGDTTADEITGFFNWNRLINEKSYAGLRVEGRRDEIADIDYRIQATALYGYYFVKNDTTTFAIEGGPGYTVQSLDGSDDNYAHFYVGQKFSHWLTDNARVFQSFAGYLNVEDTDQYNFIFTVGAEALMSESLSLKVTVENKFDSEPAAGSEENDLKLISSISYKF